VVRFNIVCGAILHGLWCALAMLTNSSVGKEISEEEGDYRLSLLLLCFYCVVSMLVRAAVVESVRGLSVVSFCESLASA